jgi:diguanylate cyclase (GGDEF)-like protein/PAS domain S-box-containing protein
MTVDIQTLAILLSFTNIIQVIVLLIHYRLNRQRNGLGWWTLGLALGALSFALNSVGGDGLPGKLADVGTNALFISCIALIHTGIQRFFGQREKSAWLLALCILTTFLSAYFTFSVNDSVLRRVIISLAVASLCFYTAWFLFRVPMRTEKATAHFLMLVFILTGIFFVVRAASPLFEHNLADIINPNLIQISTYLVMLAATTFWTFGLIEMVNQRLIGETRDARQRSESLLAVSPDSLLVTRLLDGKIVEVNEVFCLQSGFSREEVLGKTTIMVGMWKLPAERHRLMLELQENGSVANFESIFLRKDGSEYLGLLTLRTFMLDETPHLVSILHDITDRKRIENILVENEQKYRLLFQDSPDAYLIIQDGVFVDCNPAACSMMLAQRENILGHSPDQLSPEFQPDGLRSVHAAAEKINRAMQSGSFNFEWVHRRMNGVEFFVDVTIARITLAGKSALFTSWRDMTIRKRADDELRQSEQRYRNLAESNIDVIYKLGQEISDRERAESALRESEKRYRLLAENTTDVIWIVDPATLRFLYISPSVELLLGYTYAEIMAMSFADFIAPEMRHSFLALTNQRVERYLHQDKPSETYLDQLSHRRKDGSQVWTETVITIYENNEPVRTEIQGVSRDITVRKKLEEELSYQATTDELTRTFNRRHFIKVAQAELKRSIRQKHTVSIVLIDIDHFKHINDTYGHPAGDQALVIFTERCRESIRDIDVFARFGGDEFALLLPETNVEQARFVVNRVHQAIVDKPFILDDQQVTVTMTAGAAVSHGAGEALDSLLIRADQALYLAKEAGRNRIHIDAS